MRYRQPLACACLLFFAVILTKPFAEIGICDDWSYIWSARVLADTGHIVYNGWGAMMLGWQLYLGALAIKLFGFSFLAPRLTVLAVSLACCVVMHRCFVRSGTTETTASLATLGLVFSPLLLPLTMNFMTDIPGLFVIVLCVYFCLRAMQSTHPEAWLAVAYLSNVLGGTVRQIAWLGALVMVPTVAFYLRRFNLWMWLASATIIAIWMHWFRVQNYIVPEPVFYRYHGYTALFIFSSLFSVAVCLVPILLAFFGKVSKPLALIGLLAGVALFLFGNRTHSNYFHVLQYLPFGNGSSYLSAAGLGPLGIPGAPDVTITPVLRFLLTILCTTLVVSVTPFVWRKREGLVFIPFSIAYFFMVATRLRIYDRYYLPLIFILTLILVRAYIVHISQQLPLAFSIAIAVYALYSVGVTHDMFAYSRARLQAANEIQAAGVPRTSIEGGYEFDGWTELEQSGHINDIRIDHPANSYRKWVAPAHSDTCPTFVASYFPSVTPTVQLAQAPWRCYPIESSFPRVRYHVWLAPQTRYIYILDATKGLK